MNFLLQILGSRAKKLSALFERIVLIYPWDIVMCNQCGCGSRVIKQSLKVIVI